MTRGEFLYREFLKNFPSFESMVKKYEPPKPEEELDEEANISPVLLVVVTVVEMLLIGVFIFLIMNK